MTEQTQTSYIREYDAIITKYKGIEDEINERYDDLRDEIEAKEITLIYTQADKEAELTANETARQAELDEMEQDKEDEIEQFQEDYKTNMDKIKSLQTQPIDYDYLNEQIENLDFTVSENLNYEEDLLEDMGKVMAALPTVVNNTKYIYLTLNDKYDALKDLADDEYETYTAAYDEITERYAGLRAIIEAKEITENYTQADKDAELQANETAKNAEIEPINADYLGKSGAIAVALTNLKTDKETGFIGDVHINGKLHIDNNLNIEGNLNNIPISDYLTTSDITQITTDITNLQTGKADINHNHNSDYAAINHNHNSDYAALNHNHNSDYAALNHNHDSEYAAINHNHNSDYAAINHTHTTFNNLTVSTLNVNSTAASTLWTCHLSVLDSNLTNGHNYMIRFGRNISTCGCGQLSFMPDASNPYVWLGMCGADYLLKIYRDKIETSLPLTASNLTSDNNTRLTAAETLIQSISTAITGKADINHNHNSDYAAISHNHNSDYAAISHTHTLSEITDYTAPTAYDDTQLRTLINGKADTSHTHNISDITNLQTNLTDINNLISNKADESMLTALTARVVIVETGKADINHNHDTAYAAINHTHSDYAAINHTHSEYVEKANLITQEATTEHSETITFISYTQTEETATPKFTYSINNQTITIDINDDILQETHSISMNLGFDNSEERYYSDYHAKQIISLPDPPHYDWSINDTPDDYNTITTHNISSVWTYANNHLSVSITIHTNMNTSNNNFYIGFYYKPNDNYDFTFNYTTAIIYKDVLNTNATEGNTITNAINEMKTEILKTIYPIGAIYTSMTNTSPATLFGFGTWTQITDKFMYCVDSSTQSKQPGGSKTITTANLPSHSHTVNINTNEQGTHSHIQQTLQYDSGRSDGVNGRYDQNGESWSGNHCAVLYQMVNTVEAGAHTHNVNGDTGTTGGGADFLPPYITIYAWYRTA